MRRWIQRVLPLLIIVFLVSVMSAHAAPTSRKKKRDQQTTSSRGTERPEQKQPSLDNATDPELLKHRVYPSEEAVAWFRKRVDEAPADAERRGDLALALYKLSRYKDALEEAERVLATEPKQVRALLTAALVNQELGYHGQALALQKRLLEVDLKEFGDYYVEPQFIRLAIAWSHLRLGQADEADDQLESILHDQGPPLPLTLYLIERFHIRSGHATRAVELYRSILDRDTTEVNAQLAMGRLLLDAGQPASAEVFLDRAVRLDPGLKTHFYRYICRTRLGRPDDAEEDLQALFAVDAVAEEKREIYSKRIVPFPGSMALQASAHLAAGDWAGYHAMQRQLLEDDEDDPAIPFLKEEMFAESWDEACLRIQLAENPPEESADYLHFVSPLREFFTPTDPAGIMLYDSVAVYLREGRAATALALLEPALAEDSCAPGLVAQGFFAAREEGRWFLAWKLFRRLRDKVHQAASGEEADHYGPLAALLDAVDSFIRYDWMESVSWYDFAGDVRFEDAWTALGTRIAATDSLTTRTFLRIARITLSTNFLRYDRVREDLDACLQDDPQFFLARYLFDRFGRFMEF